MKSLNTVLMLCVSFLVMENAPAQKGSDYYFPLKTGNTLQYHTNGNLLWWNPRTVTYVVDGIDTIAGTPFFREKGIEVADDATFNRVFHMLWLTCDGAGNILIGAYSDGTSNIDSATVLPVAGAYFANESLVPGYAVRFPGFNYVMIDSTVSNNETVIVPAKTFTNCVKKSETHVDTLGRVIFLEYHYYAPGVGMALNVRVKPDSDAHSDELTQYSVTTDAREDTRTSDLTSYALSRNYPNPFNPSTIIGYRLSSAGTVSLEVFDLLGRTVRVLVNRRESAGVHSVTFNADNLPGGVYFYRLQSGNFRETRKLLLLK